MIVPHSNKDAYLDRYALPDKGHTDRSDAFWPAPFRGGFRALGKALNISVDELVIEEGVRAF